MSPDNKKFLEDNEHIWITLRDPGYMMGLDGATRSAMARIICEEFQPGYATDMWCPPCVADMVTLLYRHYNAWKEKQAKEIPFIDLIIDAKSKMLNDLIDATKKDLYQKLADDSKLLSPPGKPESAQTVKASFPKHPNKHRR